MMSDTEQGRVKFFNDEYGFGFIKTSSEDVFMHVTEMPYTTIIQKGDLVEFRKVKTKKGWVAQRVVLIEKAKKRVKESNMSYSIEVAYGK